MRKRRRGCPQLQISERDHKVHFLRTGAYSELQNLIFFVTEGIQCTDNVRFPGPGFDVKSVEGKVELHWQDIISGISLPMWLGEKRDLQSENPHSCLFPLVGKTKGCKNSLNPLKIQNQKKTSAHLKCRPGPTCI